MDSEALTRAAFSFFDEIRKTGKINMYGSAPYLQRYMSEWFAVKLTRQQSRQLLKQWMEYTNFISRIEQEAVL
jgi:hypothetical protein